MTCSSAPRNPQEPILGRPQWIAVVLQSLALTAGTFGALGLARLRFDLDSRSTITVTFLTLAFAQLWHVFNMRGRHSAVFVNEITRNPWLWGALLLCTALLAAPPYLTPMAELLQLVPPTSRMWAIILALSATPVFVTRVSCSSWGLCDRGLEL